MEFKVQNLLARTGNKVSGPMSPLAFAKGMSEQFDFKVDGLCRISFNERETHQWYEGPGKTQGLTGCDTLVAVQNYSNCKEYIMMVDTGVSGLVAAVHYSNDPAMEVTITPVYTKYHFERHLQEEELKAVFKHLVENPDLLIPLEKEPC